MKNNPPLEGKNKTTPEGKEKPKYIGRVPIDAKTGKDARPKKLTNEEVLTMPDRDGTGPRKRSWRPSKKKGGRKLGKC